MAAVPMQYAGDEAALVVVNDITERKESEEKLREAEQHLSDALALAPDGVALYAENARLVLCNKSYVEITCETGRASFRERACQSVEMPVVEDTIKKQLI